MDYKIKVGLTGIQLKSEIKQLEIDAGSLSRNIEAFVGDSRGKEAADRLDQELDACQAALRYYKWQLVKWYPEPDPTPMVCKRLRSNVFGRSTRIRVFWWAFGVLFGVGLSGFFPYFNC